MIETDKKTGILVPPSNLIHSAFAKVAFKLISNQKCSFDSAQDSQFILMHFQEKISFTFGQILYILYRILPYGTSTSVTKKKKEKLIR